MFKRLKTTKTKDRKRKQKQKTVYGTSNDIKSNAVNKLRLFSRIDNEIIAH